MSNPPAQTSSASAGASAADILRENIRSAMDVAFMNEQMQLILGETSQQSLSMLVDRYFNDERSRIVSPNASFDEIYYRRRYKDIQNAVAQGAVLSGFTHFIQYGFFEGRFPSHATEVLASSNPDQGRSTEDAATASEIIRRDAICSEFARRHPFFSMVDIYNHLGRKIVRSLGGHSNAFQNIAERHFDRDFYISQFDPSVPLPFDDAFRHYIDFGAAEARSPNSSFDEEFYVSFYDDVRLAKRAGQIVCGYHHYLLAGKREGRLVKHTLQEALEARLHGITTLTGVQQLSQLADKLRPPIAVQTDKARRRLNILLPDLNPDIFFGGYKSIIEFIASAVERGITVRVIKTESSYDGSYYFMYHHRNHRLKEIFSKIEVVSIKSDIDVGEDDAFLAYSTWDAHQANALAKSTKHKRFIFFIQEYEPIFFNLNSHHFLSANAYRFRHYPIFNSQLLKEYFQENGLGVFREGSQSANSSFFEHVLAKPSTVERQDPDRSFNFFVYARPEGHAGRNLFEVTLLALRRAIRIYQPNSQWKFFGLGSLGKDVTVDLGGGHALDIKTRIPYEEYAQVMGSVDVGLSLMYAPHPSVIPFELAQNGAFVVTNTFANRSREVLSAISANIVPVEPGLQEIVDGIVECFHRIEEGQSGVPHIIERHPQTWAGTFDHVFEDLKEQGFI